MRSAHWLRGLLPKECPQTSLDSAVCRCGRADSCAMVRPLATASAEALLSLESAQPHNWQRTEPLRNPVQPFYTQANTQSPNRANVVRLLASHGQAGTYPSIRQICTHKRRSRLRPLVWAFALRFQPSCRPLWGCPRRCPIRGVRRGLGLQLN